MKAGDHAVPTAGLSFDSKPAVTGIYQFSATGLTAHLNTHLMKWCLAGLVSTALHIGGAIWLSQWQAGTPTAVPPPIKAQLVIEQSVPTPPAAVSPPTPKTIPKADLQPPQAKAEPEPKTEPPTPPIKTRKPRPKPVSKTKLVFTPPAAPIPLAEIPLPPVAVADPAAPAPPVAPTPPPELAVHCSRRRAPTYPAAARRRELEGSVLLQVALNDRGAIQTVTVIESSGSRWLDDAAITAVRRWRCEPAKIDGKAVSIEAFQRINFSLK